MHTTIHAANFHRPNPCVTLRGKAVSRVWVRVRVLFRVRVKVLFRVRVRFTFRVKIVVRILIIQMA